MLWITLCNLQYTFLHYLLGIYPPAGKNVLHCNHYTKFIHGCLLFLYSDLRDSISTLCSCLVPIFNLPNTASKSQTYVSRVTSTKELCLLPNRIEPWPRWRHKGCVLGDGSVSLWNSSLTLNQGSVDARITVHSSQCHVTHVRHLTKWKIVLACRKVESIVWMVRWGRGCIQS